MESKQDAWTQELEGVTRALERAAQRAAEIARRTGTPLIVCEDGVAVERAPDEAMRSDKKQTR